MTIPERAEGILDNAGVFGRDGGDRVSDFGQNLMTLEDKLQGEVGLRQEDAADSGGKVIVAGMALVKTTRHVHAFFELDEQAGFRPTVNSDADGGIGGGFGTPKLLHAFKGEVRQIAEGVEN